MLRYALSVVCMLAALLASRAAPADELKLIMTTIAQPTSPVGQQTYHEWADRINTQGKGVVQIDVRDGYTLASSTNFYDRLLSDASRKAAFNPSGNDTQSTGTSRCVMMLRLLACTNSIGSSIVTMCRGKFSLM